MAGYSINGFERKTFETIVSEIVADELSTIAPDLVTDPSEPLGQLNGIIASKIAEMWEAMEIVYNASNPNAAEGLLLRSIAAITGTTFREATKTLAVATVNLNAGVTLPAGSLANKTGYPAELYQSLTAVTNSTAFPANFSVEFECIKPGPFELLAGQLTTIAVPYVGWNSITNAADAEKGLADETDAELRVRRVKELAGAGGGTVDGIRADVIKVKDVLDVGVEENNTDSVVDGMSPHSIRVSIWDGLVPSADDTEIATAIFQSKGAGINTNGGIVESVLDGQGNSHVVRFQRLTQRAIHVALTVTYDPSVFNFPAGVQLVKDAILLKAAARQSRGRDVIAEQYKAAVIAIQGVEDVTNYDHGIGFAVDDATIIIGSSEIAIFDSANITVTLTPAASL